MTHKTGNRALIVAAALCTIIMVRTITPMIGIVPTPYPETYWVVGNVGLWVGMVAAIGYRRCT